MMNKMINKLKVKYILNYKYYYIIYYNLELNHINVLSIDDTLIN